VSYIASEVRFELPIYIAMSATPPHHVASEVWIPDTLPESRGGRRLLR